MSEPSDDTGDGDDDVAIVLEAIDFMLQLKDLPPEARSELQETRSRIERFRSDPSLGG